MAIKVAARLVLPVKGFTLVEVLIVAAIVAILAAIAYPSYMAYVLKSGRADAKIVLNDTAQRLNRCFTASSSYKPANGICKVVDAFNGGGSIASQEGQYAVAIADHTATTWTLTATPVAGSRQAKDTQCASLSLNQAGQRSAKDSSAAENMDCW